MDMTSAQTTANGQKRTVQNSAEFVHVSMPIWCISHLGGGLSALYVYYVYCVQSFDKHRPTLLVCVNDATLPRRSKYKRSYYLHSDLSVLYLVVSPVWRGFEYTWSIFIHRCSLPL